MSPIPGPIILLALPLIAAAVAYLLRRLTILAALVSTLTAGLLAILCLRLPLDRSAFVLGQEVGFGRPIVVLGQTLMLNPAGQIWLVFVFGLAALFYLVAWRMSQGRSFFSFSLVVVALYVLVVLLETFALATLILAISATLLVFILQAGQMSSIRGAQRYLVVTLLAVPFLLLAAACFIRSSPRFYRWLIENRVLGAYIRDYLSGAGVPARTKIRPVARRTQRSTWVSTSKACPSC